MAGTKPKNDIPNFSLLNSTVYIHEPSSNSSYSGPDLILLSGWMNASPRNVAKYTAGYEKLYPSARIVVILSNVGDFFRLKAYNLKRIAPVLEALYALPSDGKLLVHSFSDGGALTLCGIAKAFLANTSRPLPMAALILDSAPGKSTYRATIRAHGVGAPRFFLLKWIFLGIVTTVYWLVRALIFLRLQADERWRMRDLLNTPTLFRREAPRLYLYSKSDYIINWRDIEEHVGDAQNAGYKVDTEMFLDTPHAGHLKGNDVQYWSCVNRLWDAAS